MLASSAATAAAIAVVGGAVGAFAVAAALPPAAAAATTAPGDWTTPGLAVPEDPSRPKFYRTASGVKVQRLADGSSGSPVAKEGDVVLFDYTLRRSNGFFVYSTVEGVSDQPKDVPVGPVSFRLGGGSGGGGGGGGGAGANLIPGLEEVLLGMSPGGRARALVPPELGYTSSALQPQPPTFATKRQLANHSREPLLFEVEVLRINGQK